MILATHHPLQSDFTVKSPEYVLKDFDQFTSIYLEKTTYLLEVSYPASKVLGSSEAAQATFIKYVFQAWDQHDENIKVINFSWLHDISPAEVDYLSEYYGLEEQIFLSFLASLGLIHPDGTEKDAFIELREQALLRSG